MNETLTIKIPFELSRYAVSCRQLVTRYNTNQVIKALDTWLVLKAEAPGSLIQHWNNQKERLLQLAKCSESIFRHRISMLRDLKLINYDRNHIRLCSWDQLAGILDIDIDKKLTFQYNIHDTQKVHQWIIATEIQDNKNRQDYMILKNVNTNPVLNRIFTAELIKQGADRTRLNDPGYFLSMLRSLYLSDFVQASEIHDDLISVRPDNNRGVRGMAAAWSHKNYKLHPTTICYWKRKLKNAGIIDISKLEIESNCRARNEFCHVIWLDTPNIRKNYPDRVKKQTMLSMCDSITILQPWLLQNKFAA